jgi:sugar phosphate isomerase/epimerase
MPASHSAAPVEGEGKRPWQIGCYTRPWAKHDYRVALDAIAEAGFKYVGLMTTQSSNGLVISVATSVEEAGLIGEECKKRGLKVSSAYCGDIPVATSLQAGIDGMHRLVDNCHAAGVANLMMGGVGDPALLDPYCKAIAACCEEAAAKEIGISMKPHGGLNATGPQCRKFVDAVGHANFGIWYDPGNIFYYSDNTLDPINDAASVDGLVVGMSVKDYLPPKNVDLTPGTGQVDFRKVLARLAEGGFKAGPLIIECLAPGELPELLQEAKKARQFVEEVVG